ncbi:MAG TPA: DUF3750 domain-containing protein [Steroidobacter sp.]
MTRKRRRIALLLLLLPLYGACSATYLGLSGKISGSDWRTASREPVGLAPDPAVTKEAVIQVYAARTISWRGYFGVHTWIATKPTNADHYTVHEVIGYRLRRAGTSVFSHTRAPDGRWFGAYPELLRDVRGPGVDALIERIEDAVERYPYAQTYRIWPGPNSNTFTAFVLREVPELRVDLPPTAIGKDYLGYIPIARTPSGTGGQVNILGVAGIAAGLEEGLELNLLGLTFGIDPASLSLKLPLLGRIGPDESEPIIY